MPDASSIGARLVAVRGVMDVNQVPVAPVDWATYAWQPIASDWLVTFPTDVWNEGWMTGRAWAAGGRVSVPFHLRFSGYELPITIHRAVVTATVSADGTTATGRVAGVVSVIELHKTIGTLAGMLGCECIDVGPPPDLVRRAADMMIDATQDPTATCDGISIAFGFDAVRSALAPGSAVDIPVPPGACVCGM